MSYGSLCEPLSAIEKKPIDGGMDERSQGMPVVR